MRALDVVPFVGGSGYRAKDVWESGRVQVVYLLEMREEGVVVCRCRVA